MGEGYKDQNDFVMVTIQSDNTVKGNSYSLSISVNIAWKTKIEARFSNCGLNGDWKWYYVDNNPGFNE